MGVGRDRIGELPEPLIHHILSFLPIKSIASTTILSKKWNNLWLSLPVLDFTQWRSPPAAAAYEEESDSDSDGSELHDSQDYRYYRVFKDSPPVDLSETNRFMDSLDKDKRLAMQLFSNCPVLEDLDMSNVSWKGLDVICFALPRLKFFTMGGFGREDLDNVKVKFDTHNLLSFTWCEYLPKEFIVVDSFPCLVEAGIRYSFADGYSESRYDYLYNLVEKVSHVKHLMVSHTYFRPKFLTTQVLSLKAPTASVILVSFEVDVISGKLG
ncbi:F-box/LRR-repeat protein At3g59200-like [Papaver somniferum]|uniref:F-box/LRR-repeat protein At3g59200-like n=1 Tax=Papaver somniferum TaxID=3469 RepID=UPI000E6F5D13|nr:F-box/LRR-repeat protein At3g59200-like [Papaver somniferum]